MNADLLDTLTITWHIDDVKHVRPDLTDQQARRVLAGVLEGLNAEYGVNWDTLECEANTLFPLKDDET